MTSNHSIAIMLIFHECITCAFFVNINLMFILSAKAISLSLSHGNSVYSCIPYMIFGWLEKERYGTFDRCFDWGYMGLQLMEEYCKETVRAERGQVYGIFGSLITWLKNPLWEDVVYLTKAHKHSVEVGDYAYGCFTSFHLVSIFFAIKPLHELTTLTQQYVDFMRASK